MMRWDGVLVPLVQQVAARCQLLLSVPTLTLHQIKIQNHIQNE
jgi:hypothetical protein